MAFEWPVRIYWEDTDAGGIVFYANYLKFFERARTEWLRLWGPSQEALRQAGTGMFVVTDTQVRYRQPAVLDAHQKARTTGYAPRAVGRWCTRGRVKSFPLSPE